MAHKKNKNPQKMTDYLNKRKSSIKSFMKKNWKSFKSSWLNSMSGLKPKV